MIASKHFLIASSTLLSINLSGSSSGQGNEMPNILLITSEYNSPIPGCYGDKIAALAIIATN